MANFKTSLLIITIAICFVAKTYGSTITCNFLTPPVYEGDTKVTLSCVLNGINIDYAVTVKRNGTEVTPRITLNAITTYEVPNTRYTVRTTAPLDRGDSTEIGYFLDIANVIRGDDGWYVFEVLSNTSSNTKVILAATTVLDVYYLPNGSPVCSPGEIYAVLGNEIELLCTIPVGKPSDSISLEWTYKSSTLSGTTIISNGSVTNDVKFVSASVEIVYATCSMSFDMPFQDEPTQTCQAGPIHFIDDPNISVTPDRLALLPGEDASFTCNIENDPIATRIWFHDAISSDRLVQTGENNGDVFITNIQLQDSGTITCRVKTGASSYAYVEATAALIVTQSNELQTTHPMASTTTPSQSTRRTTKTLEITNPQTTDILKTSKEANSTMSTDKTLRTKTKRSSTPETFVSENSHEQSPALSSSAIIGIVVCIVLIILIVIIVFGLLLWKSKRRDDSHETECDRDELQSPSAQNGHPSGTVVYADLDLTDTAPGTAVRPLSEEPTVYASVKQQKAENIYVEN